MVYVTRRLAVQQASTADPGYDPNAARRRPVQTLASDWTPTDGNPHTEKLEVYSNCEEVELLLNGKSLGSQKRPADDSSRKWEVPFVPGELKAVGRNDGKVVATHELRTAGKPARIVLATDQQKLASGWDNVAFVSATVVDDKGVRVPSATDLITFKSSGPGSLVAMDNGDNASHEPFQAAERHAYQGQCFAMAKANGTGGPITITASAPGLEGATLTIQTAKGRR
jgi:beta-galactosidase